VGYRTIIYLLEPYKVRYGGILVVSLCTSILEMFTVGAFFPFFSSVLGEGRQDLGGILGFITKAVNLLPFRDPIVAASVFLIGLYGMKTSFTVLREGLIARVSGKVLYDIKKRIMERYAGAHYQFFLDNKQGSLIYNSLSGPHKVAHLLLRIPQMGGELLKIIAIGFVLVFISPFVTLALAIMGPDKLL